MPYIQNFNKFILARLIIISLLGIGGSIVLPSFFTKTYYTLCACGSEVKDYVGTMNRAQQAYFIENNAFANNIEKLGIGIKTETANYSYSTQATDKAVFNYGIANDKYSYRTEYTGLIRTQIKQSLKSWVGGVFLVPATEPTAAKEEMTTVVILCQANSPGRNKPAPPTYQNGVLACGEGTTELK